MRIKPWSRRRACTTAHLLQVAFLKYTLWAAGLKDALRAKPTQTIRWSLPGFISSHKVSVCVYRCVEHSKSFKSEGINKRNLFLHHYGSIITLRRSLTFCFPLNTPHSSLSHFSFVFLPHHILILCCHSPTVKNVFRSLNPNRMCRVISLKLELNRIIEALQTFKLF